MTTGFSPTSIIILSFVLCVLVGWLFYLASSEILTNNVELVKTKTSEQPILALNNASSVEGRFYLGGGQIDGKMVYNYAIEEESGIAIKTVPADRVHIKYDDGDPKIETYKHEFKNNNLNLLGKCVKPDSYIIYVPEGSVKTNFTINLE